MNSLFFGTLTTSRQSLPSSGGGGGTITRIASVKGQTSSGNTFDLPSMNAAGANCIAVGVSWDSGAGSVTVTDDQGNTYTGGDATGTGTSRSQIFISQGGTYDGSLVITINGTNAYASGCAIAFSGIASSPLDQVNGASFGSVSTAQPGSITPSQASTVVITHLIYSSLNGGTLEINGGYTLEQHEIAGTGYAGAIAFLILTSSTAQNPTWSAATGGGFFNFGGTRIVSLKGA